MPVSEKIDPDKRFDPQVASGLRVVAADETIRAVEQQIAGNPDRATLFFKADIFASFSPTEEANVARAICCVMAIGGKIAEFQDVSGIMKAASDTSAQAATKKGKRASAKNKVRELYQGYARRYKSSPVEREQVTDELLKLLGLTTMAEIRAAMSAVVKPTVNVSDAPPRRLRPLKREHELALSGVMARKQAFGNLLKAENKTIEDFAGQTLSTANTLRTSASKVSAHFMKRMVGNLKQLSIMFHEVDEAYNSFAKAYEGAAKETNAKVELVAMVVSAGLGQIPVVGAVAGGVAKAIIMKFNHKAQLARSDHERFAPAAINRGAVGNFLHDAEQGIESATTLGVTPDKIQSLDSLRDLLDGIVVAAEKAAETRVQQSLEAYFAETGNGLDLINAARNHNMITIARHAHSSMDNFNASLLNGAHAKEEELKLAIDNMFNDIRLQNTKNLRRFVELWLWASYIRELVGPADFDKGFSAVVNKSIKLGLQADVVKSLDRLGIIAHKGKGQHYGDVVALGRLPYDGNPVHDLGLVMFFQWYYSINPFLVVGNNDLSDEKLVGHINTTIGKIGKAIKDNKSRGFFSRKSSISNTAAVAATQSSLYKFRAA